MTGTPNAPAAALDAAAEETLDPAAEAEAQQQSDWDDFARADENAARAEDQPPVDTGESEEAPATDATSAAGNEETPGKTGTAAAAPANTLWENATPAQKAAYEAATVTANTATQEAHRAHGTVSGLQKKVNALEKELKGSTPAKTPAGAGTDNDEDEDGTQDEEKSAGIFDTKEFKEAKAEYPEVLGPVESAFKALETQMKEIGGKVGALSDVHATQETSIQDKIVATEVPDYDAVVDSTEFGKWFETAPEYVRDGVKRNGNGIVNGLEVVDIVKKFKAETGWVAPTPPASSTAPADKGAQPNKPKTDPKRKIQLDSATTPRPSGPPAASGQTPPDDADPQAHWDDFARMDEAKAKREATG